MEIRIKVTGSGLDLRYNVQTKKGLFWKTRFRCKEFGPATEYAKDLKKCDEYNKPKNKTHKFIVWGIRQRYSVDNSLSNKVSFYSSEPTYISDKKSSCCGLWIGNNIGELKVNSLFGKQTLEPTQYKITIEEIS